MLDMVEQRLQDREAAERSRLEPVVNQIIEGTIAELNDCPDFHGIVREQLEPVIVSVIRFLAACQDAPKGGKNSHTAYLFKANALEKELQQHLADWFKAFGPYGLSIEAQQVGGGRIDLIFTFEGFRFVLEVKREMTDATRDGVAKYLPQATIYQGTDIAVGMLVVLDLRGGMPDHLRDNVWVDTMPSSEPGGTARYAIVVRVPGNRTDPSNLSKSAGKRNELGAPGAS